MSKQSSHFENLVWKYLDEEISESEFAELEKLLEKNADYRDLYQHLVEVHLSLSNHAKYPDRNTKTIAPVFAQRTSPTQGVRKERSLTWFAGIAAMMCFGLFIFSLVKKDPELEVVYIAIRDADIRGPSIEVGDRANTQMTLLMSGAVALQFPSNTKTIIEGPAFYQIQDNGSIKVSSGTITVDHQGDPGTFKVITPLGELVDMGTKFGVKIGNGVTDSMVMAEVYEGEVVYKSEMRSPVSVTEGNAFAILGNSQAKDMVSEIDGESVRVSGLFNLADDEGHLKRNENLALGKPATVSSYYNNPKIGSVFGPDGLTDNRFADSGSPWDWAFWLANDGDTGIATIDLLDSYDISRVEIQNTRNRQYFNRGMKDFVIETSIDGEDFLQVKKGTLDQIEWHDLSYYKFESFEFESTPARYVRIRGLSYYPAYNDNHMGGAGLNEVRVFE
ncbi:MAG: discoidin domain-containing protein [Verrucomicrobiota bacterium]